jgi:DNA-binding MarR family transcriptional regulator
MTVNTPRPNFSRPLPASLSGQRLYLREEELDAGLAAIFEASNILKSASFAARATHDLNWTQARAITTILRAPQGVQALSITLGLTKQAAIKTAEELEARGFAVRSSDPRDGRRRTLTLTPQGETIARDIASVMRGVLASAYRNAGGDAVAGCDAVLGAFKKAGLAQTVKAEKQAS